MPVFEVQETVCVNAGADRVHRAIREVDQWAEWSPWLILDPEVAVKVNDAGDGFRWEGPLVGSGTLRILSAESARRLEVELGLEEPWRLRAVSTFELEPRSRAVELTWRLRGVFPWRLFWRRGGLRAWVGLDCRRGLAMLKDWVELERVPSRLEFPKPHSVQGWHYVGKQAASGFDDFGRTLVQTLERVQAWLREADVDPAGPPFSIHHRWDVRRRRCEFTAGIPLTGLARGLPPDLEAGFVPKCEVHAVRHIGAHRHLANAWAAAALRLRRRVFRHDKVVPPFEVYETPPGSAAEANLVTTLNHPVV